MIAYVQGPITEKTPEHVIIDIQGVGYLAEISTQTYQQLPAEGKKIKLLIYHHITDNDQRLFGFYGNDEKELFEVLITVKGVGPKLGLTILSGLPASQIIEAIVTSDKGALTQITGIGKKTAERMILELKDKMSELAEEAQFAASDGAIPAGVKDEAISALQSLGFKQSDARKAISQAVDNEQVDSGNVQDLVKKALSRLNK